MARENISLPMRKYRRSLCRNAEHDAEVAVVVAGAADAEAANLACVLYVCAEAGAYVVVAHVDEAEGLAGIGGELAEVYL